MHISQTYEVCILYHALSIKIRIIYKYIYILYHSMILYNYYENSMAPELLQVREIRMETSGAVTVWNTMTPVPGCDLDKLVVLQINCPAPRPDHRSAL